MNPFFQCIKNLYTINSYNWIEFFNDKINGIALISVLKKDNDILEYLKKIIKYIYILDNHCLLIYMHSIIPKRGQAPWIPYTKKTKVDNKKEILHDRIRKYFRYSENEYKCIRGNISIFIEKDFNKYCCLFGVE